MATAKNIGFQSYCEDMYRELSGMKTRLLSFVSEIERMKGSEKEIVKSHVSHLQDIVRTMDWKLELLTKDCPFEWAGYKDVEKGASVQVDEEFVQKLPIGAGSVGG